MQKVQLYANKKQIDTRHIDPAATFADHRGEHEPAHPDPGWPAVLAA